MKKIKISDEMIRQLQKQGEYKFYNDCKTREESKKWAIVLATETMNYDRKYGVDSNFGIVRHSDGWYYSAQISV